AVYICGFLRQPALLIDIPGDARGAARRHRQHPRAMIRAIGDGRARKPRSRRAKRQYACAEGVPPQLLQLGSVEIADETIPVTVSGAGAGEKFVMGVEFAR